MDLIRTEIRVLCLYLLSICAVAVITIQPLPDQRVNQGDKVVLDCILQELQSSDSIVIFWYHGDTAVSVNDQLAVVNPNYALDTNTYGRWKLTIQHAQIEDQGLWRCQVQVPNEVSEVVMLTVLTPPSITAITPDLSPMPGSKVTLWCNATGSPEPTIKWQRVRPVRSFPSPPGGAFFTGSQLIISEITGDWRGLYQCIASNGIGQEVDTDEVFLKMEYSPVVSPENEIVSAPRGDSANLVCTCEAFPAVTTVNKVMWFKGNSRVDVNDGYQISVNLDTKMDPYRETSVSTLIVTQVNDNTLGEYTCRFENLLGNSEAKVTLGVGKVINPDTGKSVNKASSVMAAYTTNLLITTIATVLVLL